MELTDDALFASIFKNKQWYFYVYQWNPTVNATSIWFRPSDFIVNNLPKYCKINKYFCIIYMWGKMFLCYGNISTRNSIFNTLSSSSLIILKSMAARNWSREDLLKRLGKDDAAFSAIKSFLSKSRSIASISQ